MGVLQGQGGEDTDATYQKIQDGFGDLTKFNPDARNRRLSKIRFAYS
jgi:hypothetical protein